MSTSAGNAVNNAEVPTINDLRVKMCYICREEERRDTPSDDPPRPWTHPCKCTLIAHEHCLLKWIQTSQSTPSRAANALSCPQCGAEYELESNNPAVLKAIELGNHILQKFGGMFMVFGAAAVFTVVGTSVYVVCTGYGAWAVRKFVGTEMFNLLLTDDPSNWPWTAFINLPLLPFSLILSRFVSTSQMSPAIPILLAWPPSFPASRKLSDYWRLPQNAHKLIDGSSLDGVSRSRRSWPPSPILFGLFGFPMVKMFYQVLYARLYFKVMGKRPPGLASILRGNGPGNAVNQNGNGRRNNVAAMNIGDGPFVIRLRANVREEVRPVPQGDVDGNNNNNNPEDQVINIGEDIDAEGGAEQTIEINASSLGRKVGGALLIPAISSWMGHLLLRLSRHSTLLREFLAIQNPVGAVWLPPPIDYAKDWKNIGLVKQMTVSVQLIFRAFWANSGVFSESDPVWWRNTIGLGLFVVAKDCLQLLHLWLSKREMESRKVKNRDFSGVDIGQLDLMPEFLQRLRR